MLHRIGGLNKMIDNQAMADNGLNVDESLRALCRVSTPMARSTFSTRFIETLRYGVRGAWVFVGGQSLLGFEFVGAEL